MLVMNRLLVVYVSVFLFNQLHAADEKNASSQTNSANYKVLQELPFSDKQSFEDAKRGFIAPLPKEAVTTQDGRPVWNPNEFDFITIDSEAPSTVNPSLWRQSKLVNQSGLYKVTDRIYQVRNYDLSNMTIIEGDNGIIIADPLVSIETAKAALDLYFKHRPKKPVKAVIYSHSHVDHYGGVRGVISEDDVKSGEIKIIAPENFIDNAVSENVLAGNAMSRRSSYMYGNLLPHNPQGQVGAGLGSTTSTGTVTLIPPTDIISKSGQKMEIDGLTFEFLMTPDSEAPSEMHWYIPELKALTAAENSSHTMHNVYTLRGARGRNPLAWSKYLHQTLLNWGDDAEVLYGMHHWPVWDKENVQNHLKLQRDLYRYINDETLRLANHGYNMTEIAEMIKIPPSLENYWANRGYYGSLNHNVKGTYVYYLGWFDGNPATLHALPRKEAGIKYVNYMGGSDAVLKKAKEAYRQGDYRWVAQVVNHVVFAEPDNEEAKLLQGDALEQMGYQAESGPWRNFYLSGAKELRGGIKVLPTPDTASPDSIRSMDLDMFFDFLAMKMNGPKATGKQVSINFVFPDTSQKYLVEVENGVLNHSANRQLDNADTTIELNRTTLNNLMLGTVTLDKAIETGKVKINGDEAKFKELLTYMDQFNFWFPLVTPNKVQ
jgi:linear primary-alkylsulfatase